MTALAAVPGLVVAAEVVGLVVLAGGLAAVLAVAYRWYARGRVPSSLASLVGLGGIAVYLNTTATLGQVIGGETELLEPGVALLHVGTFLAGWGAAAVGARLGDRFAVRAFSSVGAREVEELAGAVRAGGRVISVELPDRVEDLEGYDTVPPETKEALRGRVLLFPRGLTLPELRDRLVSRLKSDFGVGRVDVEVAPDGSVEYLALGSRVSGVGPTLPPGSAAVALRADPAFSTGPGDAVQVWGGEPLRRLFSGEVRGVSGDVVTLAVDEEDVEEVDWSAKHRLVTLPVDGRAEREFLSVMTSAEETLGVFEAREGGLAGVRVGDVEGEVVAVEAESGGLDVVPSRSRVLEPGDAVYVLAVPEVLRRVEARARRGEG